MLGRSTELELRNQRMGRKFVMPSYPALPLLLSTYLLHFGVTLQVSFITVENSHQQLPNLTATWKETD